MLCWSKQFSILHFCESDDKISTLRQLQNWACILHDELSTYFLVFLDFCVEFAPIFMHEFVKIQDISITGLAKMSHWEDFKISQWFPNLISSISEFRFSLHITSYQSQWDGIPKIIDYSWLLPHFCLEPRLAVTPPICYLPLHLTAAPNVNVSWDSPL